MDRDLAFIFLIGEHDKKMRLIKDLNLIMLNTFDSVAYSELFNHRIKIVDKINKLNILKLNIMERPLKNYVFLTLKDIMNVCDCSEYTARKIRKDIADEYRLSTKRVTHYHLVKYLKLDE